MNTDLDISNITDDDDVASTASMKMSRRVVHSQAVPYMKMSRALVIGDGPSYHSVANVNWGTFDGLVISTHVYRQRAGVVISIDPRGFQTKERHAIGRARLVIAMSHWGNGIGLKRFVPNRFHKDIEWAWCAQPVLTSGVYAIEWAAKQGYKEIYTIGIDLSPGYHRSLDTQRHVLAKSITNLERNGSVRIYKRSPLSTLPVPVRDPAEHLPPGIPRPPPSQKTFRDTPQGKKSNTSNTINTMSVAGASPRRFLIKRPLTIVEQSTGRRVLLRPKNGQPRDIYVPNLPRY